MYPLNEILDKLNFLMAHIHLMVDGKVTTVMELYQLERKSDQIMNEVQRPSEETLRAYAHSTGKYRVGKDNTILVDYNGVEYSIGIS